MLYGMQTATPTDRLQRGYTLVEIMVVLLIVAVVAAVTVPNVMRTLVKAQGNAEIGAIKNGLALVRTRAIQTGGQTVVWFDVGGGQDFVRGWIDTNGNEVLDAGETTLLTHAVDPRIQLTPDTNFADLGGTGTNRGVIFQPNGSTILATGAVGSANLVMTDERANTVRLVVQAPAGTSRAQMQIPGTTNWDDALKHWRF